MSITKIIKGWVRDKEDDRQTIFQVDIASQGHFEVPCTLYIGTGKLWTEEEVRAELARKDAEIEALREQLITARFHA